MSDETHALARRGYDSQLVNAELVPATAIGNAVEGSEPFVSIVVIVNDVHAIDTAIGDVTQAAGEFDS